MRSFLAVHPGPRFVAELDARLDGLRRQVPMRWTRPETWHLTLQFLGEWPQGRLKDLQRALLPACDLPGFILRPGGLGAFPERGQPRVLFLHLDGDGADSLLVDQVRKRVAGCWSAGPQDCKPFCAHLTVGRTRQKLAPDQLAALQEFDPTGLGDIAVSGFRLMASELIPGGARHTEMAFFPLRKKGE